MTTKKMDLRNLATAICCEAERQLKGMTRAEYGAVVALATVKNHAVAINQVVLTLHNLSNELRMLAALVPHPADKRPVPKPKRRKKGCRK